MGSGVINGVVKKLTRLNINASKKVETMQASTDNKTIRVQNI